MILWRRSPRHREPRSRSQQLGEGTGMGALTYAGLTAKVRDVRFALEKP
jgi:hypothetical protein